MLAADWSSALCVVVWSTIVLASLLDCILRFRWSSGCCLLVEVLVVLLSRVVDRFVVGVVVFHFGGVVGARCMRGCKNLICCSFFSVRSSSSSAVALSGESSSVLPSSSTFLMRRGVVGSHWRRRV